MIRRFGALSAAALLAVGIWAQPAAAAAPTVRISTPGAGAVVTDSTPNVAGDAQMNEGIIIEVTASISSADGKPVPPAHRVSGDNRSSVAFAWTPSLPWNGRYTITLRATGEDRPVETNGRESAETTRNFSVEAPPAVPKDVKVRADPDSRDVDVTWTDNKEPDLIGYQVQRSFEGGEWLVAGEADKNFFRDTSTAERGGTYRYRVVAVRAGATKDSGVASAPSQAASTTVPKPPPKESSNTTQPPGGSDQGPSGDGSQNGGASPGAGGGTSGRSGSGGGSSGGSSPQGPVVSRSGRVDLSGFGSLLDQTRAPQAVPTPEPDGDFSEQLPFEPRTITEPDGMQELAVPDGGFSDAESDQASLLRFFAAGLLVTVILMHVLWLRAEVERVPLEVASGEGP